MKVLVYATGADTGGQGVRIRDAFARNTDWQVDAIADAVHPFKYPEQHRLKQRDRLPLIKRLYDEANVVHLRNTMMGWARLDRGQCKPVVLHHHGRDFRSQHAALAGFAREVGAVQVASTIDLTLLEPDVQWLPSPYPIDELAAMRRPNETDRVRIAYFPTSPAIKSADVFLAAYRQLAQTHDVELLTNAPRGRVIRQDWQTVMAQKATADIYFDQVKLGYGNNAIEAWGMGIPVVAGTEDPAVRDAMLDRFGELPYVEATEQTIYDALRSLVESKAMRDEYGQRGMEHVKRFHDYQAVVPLLMDIYQQAHPTVPLAYTVNTRLVRRAA